MAYGPQRLSGPQTLRHREQQRRAASSRATDTRLRAVQRGRDCALEKRGVEGQRQQVAQLMAPVLSTQVRQNHFEISAELPEDLAARPAGRRRGRVSATMAIRRNRRCPSESALNIATRSAQMVRP